jgi:hypothetical protein
MDIALSGNLKEEYPEEDEDSSIVRKRKKTTFDCKGQIYCSGCGENFTTSTSNGRYLFRTTTGCMTVIRS